MVHLTGFSQLWAKSDHVKSVNLTAMCDMSPSPGLNPGGYPVPGLNPGWNLAPGLNPGYGLDPGLKRNLKSGLIPHLPGDPYHVENVFPGIIPGRFLNPGLKMWFYEFL